MVELASVVQDPVTGTMPYPIWLAYNAVSYAGSILVET
jgi:hypothetical protein